MEDTNIFLLNKGGEENNDFELVSYVGRTIIFEQIREVLFNKQFEMEFIFSKVSLWIFKSPNGFGVPSSRGEIMEELSISISLIDPQYSTL